MQKKGSKTNLSGGGPNFANSFNVVADLANAYSSFDGSQQQQQPAVVNSPQQRRPPQAARPQVQQQSQFRSTGARQRSSTPKKGTPQRTVNKSNSQSRLPQQQQHHPLQPVAVTATEAQSPAVKAVPSCTLSVFDEAVSESDVLHTLKLYEKNIMMNSFFEEYYRNNLIQQNIKFFTAFVKAEVIANKNDMVVLNFAPFVKHPKPEFDSVPFQDMAFPCTDEAFTWGNRQSSHAWSRPSEGSTVFSHLSPETVVQGQLGDCYLISSISVLADYPNLLRRLIRSEGNGKYTVWLCPDGRWKAIVVDDSFPMSGNGFLGAHPVKGDIGVMLLEKAFAKQYGRNYRRIEVGFSLDALKDLTGAPAEYIDLKDLNQAFTLVQDSLEKGFVLTVSSKPSAHDSNVVSRHCYGILAIRSITQPGNVAKVFRLVKLRNPYGNLNYVNTSVPQYVIEKLGEPLTQSGGVFWMRLEDFVKDFEVVTVCKLYQNYVHQFIKMKQHNMIFGEQSGMILVHALRQTHVYFGIHQKHARYYKLHPQDQDSYKYEVGRLILAQVKQVDWASYKIVQVISGAFSCYQSTFLEAVLQKGTYMVFAQVDGESISKQRVINYKRVSSYCVSCYSENPVAMSVVQDVQCTGPVVAQSVLRELMFKYVEQNIPSRGEEWCKYLQKQPSDGMVSRYHGTSFGHVFIYHHNECTSNRFIDQLTFLTLKNLKHSQSSTTIELPPQSVHLMLLPIENADNCSHKIVFSSKSFFESQLQWSDLKTKAVQESQGKKRQRGGKDINVSLHQYKYNGGVMLVYVNQTKQVYDEQVTFTNLENCYPHNSNDEPYPTKTVNVSVAAGDTFAINLKIANRMSQALKYQLSYK